MLVQGRFGIFRVPELQRSGGPEVQSSRVQELRISGLQDCKIRGVLSLVAVAAEGYSSTSGTLVGALSADWFFLFFFLFFLALGEGGEGGGVKGAENGEARRREPANCASTLTKYVLRTAT